MTTRILVSLALLGASSAALAAVDRSAVDPATELFRLSGMEQQIAAIEPGIEQQFAAQTGALPSDVRARVQTAIRAAFDTRTMQRDALAHLKAHMEPARANEVIDWLQTPFGLRVVHLEEAASEPEAMAKLEAYAASLPDRPPSAQRLVAIQRLNRAVRGTELMTEVLFTMTAATGRAVVSAMPEAGSMEELESQLASQRPALQMAAKNLMLTSMLFTYRELDDAELASYIEFLEAPTGQWYQTLTGDALLASLGNAAQRFASSLAELIQEGRTH